MPKGPFNASQFVATEWNSAADKAAFGNTYLHFIESGWKQSLFTKGFYQRLSNCFSHIAHFDVHGFYQTWFTCDQDRLEFLRWDSRHPCHGDPKFTFSDVERAIQQQIRSRNYVALYELKAAGELRSREMAVLVRLESKYRSTVVPGAVADTARNAGDDERPAPPASAPVAIEPVQISLF